MLSYTLINSHFQVANPVTLPGAQGPSCPTSYSVDPNEIAHFAVSHLGGHNFLSRM